MTFRYTTIDTPVGEALVVDSPDGLVAVQLPDGPLEHRLESLAHRLGALPEPDPEAATDAARQISEYFDGTRRRFDLELDWRLVGGFTLAALQEICEIPYGETASYGEIAIRAGRPRAARAAGTACRITPFSLVVPVHRVVRADGTLGQYGAHPEVKRHLVELERRHATPTPPPDHRSAGE